MQWLTENLVLSIDGGVCGVALAYGAVQLVVAFGPADVPRLDETIVDGPVLAFTLLVAMLAGALPALAPAVRVLRTSSHAALKDGIGGYSAAARGRGGAALIVAEVALAMTLAVGGALLFKSFARLTAVAPGFDPERVLSLKVFLTPPRYRTVASGKQYIRSSLERMAAIPGVESVAAVSQLPLGDPSSTQLFDIEGQTATPADRPSAGYRAVSANYFATLRIPLVRGRALSRGRPRGQPARRRHQRRVGAPFWPNEDPIGQRIRWATGIRLFDKPWHTVVGVAADVKSSGLDKPEPPAIYAPYTQRMFTWLRWNSFVVRTHGEPQSYARAIRQELTKIDPMQPIYQVASLDDVISQSVAARRFHTGLIDVFAALALGAVRGRRLRHHRLLGRRTDARNRRAHGARRHPPRHHADGGRPRERLHGASASRSASACRSRPVALSRRCCSAWSRSTSPRSRPWRWSCSAPVRRRRTSRRGARRCSIRCRSFEVSRGDRKDLQRRLEIESRVVLSGAMSGSVRGWKL